tara:strand:- start:2144 stop:2665 length:522 start_codon:yes stop_codon:yes gene_type:complete
MATLTAVRTEGGQFTPDDALRVSLNDSGQLKYCVHYLEIVSGATVTHGGGAQATESLHYKAIERDADGDGIIDYSTVNMRLVQTEKGTNVVKVCAKFITKAEWDTYLTNTNNWLTTNCVTKDADADAVGYVHSDGLTYTAKDGVSMDDLPSVPTETVAKTGDITLVWQDDDPV